MQDQDTSAESPECMAAPQVPPFKKGGLGGISGCYDTATIKQNPPRPPFRKGGRSLFLSIVTLGLSFPVGILANSQAQAQQTQAESASELPNAVALPEMTVTASREERASFDVPRAVTVIGREALERQSPTVLPDLLRGQAGVFVQQTTPGQAAPVIRGLLGSATLMLVDGMRLNTAFFRPAPNQYFALVDPFIIDQMEVVRGAGSTLYGSDAMGGVVNVLSRVPQFDSEDWQWHGRALGQFSSSETAGVTRVSVAGGKRGIGLSGGFTYRSLDDRQDGGGSGVQRSSGYDVYAANGAFFGEWQQHDLFVNLQYARQPKTPRFDELVAGFGQTQPSSAVFSFEPNDRLFIHGRYRVAQPFSFLDRLELHVAFQEINDDRRSRDFDSTLEQRERNRSRMTGVTLQFTSHWSDWIFFTYGGEIYLDKITSRRIGRDIESQETLRQRSRFADGSRLDSYAGYLQTEIWLHPRLTAILGGRFSYFDIDIPQADRDVGVNLGLDDLTGSGSLIFHATPSLNLITNVGRGFRVPNVFDLSTLGPRPGNRFNIPNPGLSSESVVTVDVGAKWDAGRLWGEVFGFYSDFQDKITAVPTGDFTDGGRQIVQSQNLNSVEIWGVEAAGRWSVSERWEVFGSFTYTWAEEELQNGRKDPASRIPPANGRVGGLYTYSDAVWLEGFLRFATDQDRLSERDTGDPRINPNGTPGWVTASLRAGWQINAYLAVKGALENVFDKSYREHGSGSTRLG